MTLQAATGGTVELSNLWRGGAPGATTSVTNSLTVGSVGNTGTVILNGQFVTSGSVAVNYGTLRATIRLSAAAGVTIDGSTAELKYTGSFALTSPVSLVRGTLSGDATISTVAATGGTISVDSGDEIEISGTLSGSGTLAKTGAGTLRIASTNTFSGTLNVSAGNVVVGQIPTNPGSLATSATFTSAALTVAFTADPTSGAKYVLLAGPTTQTYTPTLTGTTKTATYNAATATLTIT